MIRTTDDGTIQVSKARAVQLAQRAAKPWEDQPAGPIPQHRSLVATIRTGLRPGEIVKSGSQRWTYLGAAEVLHQVYADGYVAAAGQLAHPLLYQRTLTPNDSLIETLLIYKAQATIKPVGGFFTTIGVRR